MATNREAYAVAEDHYRSGRVRDAFNACQSLLERDPHHADALHLSAVIAHGFGRNDIAAAFAGQAVALKGNIPSYYNTLGTVQAGLEKLVDAERSFRRAVDLAPADPGFMCNLGLTLCRLGRTDEAVPVFRQALALDPTSARSPAQDGLARALYPGDDYRTVLSAFHAMLRPAAYVEIGVSTGASLTLVRPPTLAIGIDPAPCVTGGLPESTRLFAVTSDAFFSKHDLRAEFGGRCFDLAFVDGLHTFEQTLTDIANLERYAGPDSVILVHDVLPGDAVSAGRDCCSALWAGDTWKIVPALRRARPDLEVSLIPTAPTGLAVIRGLAPARSDQLLLALDQIVADFMPLTFADFLALDAQRKPLLIANEPAAIQAHLLSRR